MNRKVKLLAVLFIITQFCFGFFRSNIFQNVLKVAAIVPGGEIGEAMRNAINMSAYKINASGGIMNKKVRIIWVKESWDMIKFKNDLMQAVERDGAKFFIGGYTSTRVSLAMKVMKEKKILFLGTGGAHPAIVGMVANDPGMKYYFRVGTLDSSYQARAISDFAINVLLPKKLLKVAYIRVNHYYALRIIKPAREEMERAGFKTVIKDEAVKFMATDFGAFLDKCIARRVQVIACSFLVGETNNFIRQAAARGINKKMVIFGAMMPVLKDEYPQEVGGADVSAYVTSFSPQAGPVDMTGDGAAVRFAREYKARYGKSAYWISYMSYDTLRILKAAVEKARTFNSHRIVRTMEASNFEFRGLINYKWKKHNHDLYFGFHNGKRYADFAWFQFYPNGKRYCVYPNEWKQRHFLSPGSNEPAY